MSWSQEHPPYSFDFCPLPNLVEDFRVLKITLSSSHYEDEVEAQLLTLDQRQEYAALSWCWGPHYVPKRTIRITHRGQPYSFAISASLDLALKTLRKHKVEYVWIDQICE